MSTEMQQQQPTQGVTLKDRQQKVSDLLEKYRGSIAQALPKHLTADRMIRVALTSMTKTPDLLLCTPHSLISCVITAGQLGLMPDSILGECYLIPFNNNAKQVKECQIIIGYKGLVALAMRSGQVKSVQARAVYAANGKTSEGEEGDFFEYELGLDEKLKHVPKGVKDDQYITHFYAVVKFHNGGHVFEVMTREQVIKIRDESKNYKHAKKKEDTIWAKWFGDMGCKSVLRKLMKFVPLSPELQKALSMDEAADYGKQNIGVEILDDPNTPEEFVDAVYEEISDEYNQEYQEGQQEEVKERDGKVVAAMDGLDKILSKNTKRDKK